MKPPTKENLETLEFALQELRDLEKEFYAKRKVLQDHLSHLAGVAWGLKPGAHVQARGKLYALTSWTVPESTREPPRLFGVLIKKDGSHSHVKTRLYSWDNPVIVEEEQADG